MALYDSQIQDVLGRAVTPQEQNALKYDSNNKSYNVSIDDLTKFKSNLAKTPSPTQTNVPGYSFQGNNYEYQTRQNAYGVPYTLGVLAGTPQPVTDVRNEQAITPGADVVGDQMRSYMGKEGETNYVAQDKGYVAPNSNSSTSSTAGSTGSNTLNQYKDVQGQIATIDKAINDSYINKKKEIESQGGIVNETQLRAQIANEQAPLINQRKTLASSQANLSKQYQQELSAQKVADQTAKAQSNNDYRNRTADQRDTALQSSNAFRTHSQMLQDAKFGASQSNTSALGNGAYTSDLDAMIGNIPNLISSANGKAAFISSIKRARNDSDKINAIASVVLANAPAEEKKDFTNQSVAIKQIDKALSLIESGVKTGALQAGSQYVFNLFGKDYDPKLAQLTQLIISAVQPYRNSVTGAAWGTQEEGEYQSLFGSTKYSPTELKQRLEGIRQIMKDKTSEALNAYVNPTNAYDNPFANTNVGGGNSTTTPEYARSVVNTVISSSGLTGNETLSQALAMNPNKFVDAMIAQEGGSLAGVNNNPGNIKYAGLPGQKDSGIRATDGGTFASYSSPILGKQAVLSLLKGYDQNQPVKNAIAAYKGVKDAHQGGTTNNITAGSVVNYQSKRYQVDAQGNMTQI